MFSYIFAHSVKPHIQNGICEINQNDLQLATDKLSKFLEQKITNDNAMDFAQNIRANAS